MALEGPLREFPITDIIQLVSLRKQTGAAELTSVQNNKPMTGRVYFRNGNIVHANLNNNETMGIEALFTFFTWEDGNFRFLSNEMPEREDIKQSNELLVMQGVNQSDEWKQIREFVPNADLVPMLVDNPSSLGGPSGFNLKPEEWRLLTFITGQDSVASIARKSGLGEFRTSKVMAHLLQAGLLEKKNVDPRGELVYAELDNLAISQLGTTAKTLLDQAYSRVGLSIEDDIGYEQAQDIVNNFRRLSALLVGPGRAKQLADQMQERVRIIYER